MNRLNRYAGIWEEQERAMRTPTSYRNVEWDLNTSPPMQWHFGPPPSGWGSYLSGANIQTARGQVVDARLFYTPPSVRFGRGFSGLGVVGDEASLFSARTGYENQYATRITPYNIPSSAASSVPAILVEEVRREFAGPSGGFTPVAGWGSGADRGKIVMTFATARGATGLTLSRIGEMLDAAVTRAQGRLAAGQQLLLPGRAPATASVASSDVSLTAADVQRELIRSGYNVGPSGADNDWGTRSRDALDAAIAETGARADYITTRREVILPASLWAALRALPSRPANSMGPAASAPRGGGGQTDAGGSTGGGGGGGVSGGSMGLVLIAAVGVGAYLMMRNR